MAPANFTETPVDKLSAADILGIPEDAPEMLFVRDAGGIKKRFRALTKAWHADKHAGDADEAHAVTQRILKLRDVANERFKAGTWRVPGELVMQDVKTGKKIKLTYTRKKDFELGEVYIAPNSVTYALRLENKDLFDNAVRAIGGLSYANDKMKQEFSKGVPQIEKTIETADRLVMIVKKDPAMVLLSDVCDHFAGKLDARHTAWILSCLHNVACYLAYNKVTHNALSLDTFFIDPAGHTGALLGGWWYAAKTGAALTGLPAETVRVVHPEVLASGKADPKVDMILLRNVGRTLLGDRLGMRLARDKDVPKALSDWLTLPPSDNAFEDYSQWMKKVLPDSFGVRRYVKMDVTYRDIYKP